MLVEYIKSKNIFFLVMMAAFKKLFAIVLMCVISIKVGQSQKRSVREAYKLIVSTVARQSIPLPICARPYDQSGDHTEHAVEYLRTALKDAPNYDSYLAHHQRCDHNSVEHEKELLRKRRRRRSLSNVPPSFLNTIGLLGNITWELSHCYNKTHVEGNSYNMCWSCFYNVTLPVTYFPRNISMVTCHAPTSINGLEDYSCFLGEGACFENQVDTLFKHDVNDTGIANVDNWIDVNIPLTKSCSCRILESSVMSPFV